MKKIDEKYITTAIVSSIRAGKAILDVYHSDFTVEHKADKSPLTLADKRSHEIIVSDLREFGIPILSEEGKDVSYDERKKWDRLWIVDPLDGTKEFIKRNGEFTVNIALVEKGTPVMGVIFVPDRNKLYYGSKELGTYRLKSGQVLESLEALSPGDGERGLFESIVSASEKLPLARPKDTPYTVVGSRSHMSKEVEAFVEEKRAEVGEVQFVSAGSSLKFCLVDEGKADIYPRLGPTMEWDIAAGQVVAEGAGAKVFRHDDGKPMAYNRENLLNPWFVVEMLNK